MAEIGILNVGAGDTKLVFDKTNPAECIRSGRIVTDMLRRGYALLVEVDDGKGGKKWTRAKAFDEATSEYIIADFDPEAARTADKAEHAQAEQGQAEDRAAQGAEGPAEGSAAEKPAKAKRDYLRQINRAVSASSTNGLAVARSAGG